MDITISQASISEKGIVKNLLSLYLHDLSEFTDQLDIQSNGGFQYEGADLYWEKDELHPLSTNLPAVRFWERVYLSLNIKVESYEKMVGEERCQAQQFVVGGIDA